MKKKVLKGLFFLVLGYLLLVALHVLYLELGGRNTGSRGVMQAMALNENVSYKMQREQGDSKSSYGNYATLSFQAMPSQAAVEQKYEKIGSLSATTEKFETDEQRARAIIKEHNALIQEEAVNSSNELRELSLTIGVPPGNFDAVVTALQAVGKTVSYQVTKTDKTNDFLELKARRITLEKTRDSLVGLKTQGGKIDELVKLEQEILKLEDQIQGLGVQLGQFDKVNEFCTVRFTLDERKEIAVQSPHLGYVIASIEWAGTIYLMWLGIACVGLVAVILLLIIIDKSKIFRSES